MRILTLFLMGSALVSCDTKVDPIKAKNNAPVFTVSSELNNWSKDDQYTKELTTQTNI